MKTFKTSLKESLLSDEDELLNQSDTSVFKKQITDWIDEYFIVKTLSISDEPNEDGKYVVNADNVKVNPNTAGKLVALTNGMFIWGVVKRYFTCRWCKNLTSLEGAPKVCGTFACNYNDSITSFKGCPDANSIECSWCKNLVSLEGCPQKLRHFWCTYNYSLTSLKGGPKEVKNEYMCFNNTALTSLEGAPKKVGGNFDCHDCSNLTSLKGAPKEVGGNFSCWCESTEPPYYQRIHPFTELDVKSVSNVKGLIFN